MTRSIRAALGGEQVQQDWTTDEELGWCSIADAIQCLQHMRDAWSKRK